MRREFLKNLAWGAFSACFTLPKSLLATQVNEWRKVKGQMAYRRLGRTGLFISEVSLGGSPMPDWSLLRQIIERGVNYIDSSSSYDNGNAERQIGRLCREVGRDKIVVATKFHLRGSWTEESIIRSVEGSLKRLETDWIDVLSVHGAEREDDLVDERVLNAFEKLKKQGKYKFSGLSCHSNHQGVVRKAVDSGHYDMVQLGYNVFDIQDSEKDIKTYGDYLGASGIRDLIKYAASRDVGIIAMKALKVGGRRQDLEKYRARNTSLYQAMLKWVLENRNVTSVVTEMLNRDQMEEDLGAVQSSLSSDERKNLFRYVAENSRDYCHMCGRCQAQCPSRIATTEILRYLAYDESYGKRESAKNAYAALNPDETALACRNCGLCERACPYSVRVRLRIREAHTILSS
jgi:predicted aldo/keto reductase-like oxidoreductase